jgi:hypothetical protein
LIQSDTFEAMDAKDVNDLLVRLSVASDDERRQLLNNVRPILERHDSRVALKVGYIMSLVYGLPQVILRPNSLLTLKRV